MFPVYSQISDQILFLLWIGRGNGSYFDKAWFPFDRNGRKNRVIIFFKGQFIIVYTCKAYINHKYSRVITTARILSSKMLYFS